MRCRRVLADLKLLGYQVVGVESDEAARQRTRAQGIEVLGGYAETLPEQVACRRFDIVTMKHVLEHCLNPLVALGNAASLLRPGGCLAIEVPNNASISGLRSGVNWFFNDVGRHVNFFTGKSLARAVSSFDLEVVECLYGGYIEAFLPGRLVAEDVPWRVLDAGELSSAGGKGQRNSKARQWSTLFRTLFASPRRKYECVTIFARSKPSSCGSGSPAKPIG